MANFGIGTNRKHGTSYLDLVLKFLGLGARSQPGKNAGSRELEALYSDEHLRITTSGDPTSPNLIMCFTGISQAMGGVGAEEFIGSAKFPGYSAIFISDLKRSWFNGFPPSLLQDAIAGRTQGRKIVTIGNSMGGYGAIWATSHWPIATAIAFAPQYSVHAGIVPTEKRWMEYRSNITQWRDTSLEPSFHAQTQYFTLNGSLDQLHWSHFPKMENCEHILIHDSDHSPAAVLKKSGILGSVLDKCIANLSPFDVIKGAKIGCSRI